MKIIIDADGCPVVKITLNIAKKLNIAVLLISDINHNFNLDDFPNAQHIKTDTGNDYVDFYIVNNIEKNDIIITQDYALATMCLAKNCYVINQNGVLYTDKNIDELLFRRHISKKLRKVGKNSSKFKKRTKNLDEAFENNLKLLITSIIKKKT